jgi:hypothetical protein
LDHELSSGRFNWMDSVCKKACANSSNHIRFLTLPYFPGRRFAFEAGSGSETANPRRVDRGWSKIAQILAIVLAAIAAVSAAGQSGGSTAVVTLGAPPPVVGQPFTVYALVTNPSRSPAPTGSIEFDFGDGTPTVTAAMGYRVATATHTYAAVGSAKITATYSGDADFTSASAVLQGQILKSVPSVQLNVFGDSISASGNGLYPHSLGWSNIVAYVHGWTLNNVAQPGWRTADQCQFIYGTTITPASYSAV